MGAPPVGLSAGKNPKHGPAFGQGAEVEVEGRTVPGHRDYPWPNQGNGDMAKVVPGCCEPGRPLASIFVGFRRALWLGLSVADRLGLRVDRLGLRVADRLGQHLMKLSLGFLDYLIAHRSSP